MAVVRKKQDDKFLQALRELVTAGTGGNRQCFDCGQRGPTYVNMTIGSFVCTRCSGVLRGLTPPHRVKSISMATFTQEEIDFLKTHGNDLCAKTWLGLWDPKRAVHQDHRELMIDKYERKRYYLEPASPLKSLANAATLKTAATNGNANNNNNSNSSNGSNSNNSSSHSNSNNTANNHNQQNGHAPLTNGISDKNSFKNIQLTPPTSQRSSTNGGLHKTSSSAISRPHHQQNGHNHHSNGNGFHQQDAFALHNGLNGLSAKLNGGGGASSIGSASTGALSDTSSCASSGFGAEADFIADFGSANIFDATSSTAATNGYAKIQCIKAAQQQPHHFMNGNANNSSSATSSSSSVTLANGNSENFADFDHAPIYNAAGTPIPNGLRNGTSNNNAKFGTTPTEDRYAALKDLDEQFRESKAVAAAAASIVGASVVESFDNMNGTHANVNGNGNGIINPFKNQQANPFQTINGNANVNGHNTTSVQNLYGQIAVIPNGMVTNGFNVTSQTQQQQQQQQSTGFFNYNNAGYAAATTGGMYPTASVPNGCGFGFGTMQQQITAAGGVGGGGVGMTVGVFNNPFAATGALNANNPFL